jgi:GT2 family glycosyltransferase
MISILLNTCRDDYPLVGLPETFIFEPTIKSLNKQEYKEFELIIIDACYSSYRKEWIEKNSNFSVKYINAFPNRFLEKGMCAISSMKNKGLIYAEGELVVFIDDCTEFPMNWTKKIWNWFEKGFFPMSLTYYFEGGKPKILGKGNKYIEIIYGKEYYKEDKLYAFLRNGDIVRDSRADFVNKLGIVHPSGNWFYGGSSASLEALLKINGIDEKFDGKKGLEDSDTGLRLEKAGYNVFVLDKDLWHIEHWHKSMNEKVLWYKGPTPACNYALLQYNKIKNEYIANNNILTKKDCEWIRDNICPKCDNLKRCLNEEFKGKFFIECEGFNIWLNLQRKFDLREERLKL